MRRHVLQERYPRKVSGSAGSTCERVYVGIILGNGIWLTYGVALVLTHPLFIAYLLVFTKIRGAKVENYAITIGF